MAIAAIVAAANGQDAPKPALPGASNGGTVNAVQVAPGDGIFRPGDLLQAPDLPPDMPSLEKIPPMPMPGDGFRGGLVKQQGGRLITHDPVTNQTVELPASVVKWDEGQGGGFAGAGGPGEVQGESEVPTNWAGTLSAIADGTLTAWPYRANCKLAMRFPTTAGGFAWYVCSGTMIDAETVLTAGHCVYSNGTAGVVDGFATEIYVYPGWDGSGDPTPNAPSYPIPTTVFNQWGFARTGTFATWSTWANNGDFDGDVGLVRVTRAVGMLTGWYGWNYGSSCATVQGRTYNNASYPAENCGGGLHTGAQMYYWFGTVDACPNNQLQLFTSGGCLNAVWGGMSGSSLYYIDGDSRYASAVCSTSNRTTRGQYCRLFESFVNYMNDTFIPDSRGTSLDLQALRCQIADTTWTQGDVVTGLNFNACNPTNNNPASQQYAFNIYLSTDTDINTSDTLMSQQSYTFDYGAMQNVTVNCGGFTIPHTVTPGTYYLGVVLDTGTGGDTTSSNNDSDTWDAVQITVSCDALAAPTGVSATDDTYCDRVRVSWNSVTGASQYFVYRNTSNSTAGATNLGTDTASPFDDLTAVAGTTYYYFVRSDSNCSTSAYSTSNSGRRETAVGTPTGVSASDGTACGSVSVSWSAVSNADTYYIYRNTTNSTSGATYLGSDTASPYADATGTAGVTYYYYVRAGNACGIGSYSSGNAGYGSLLPTAPTGVAASDGTNCTTVTVSWSALAGADTYFIYRNTSNSTAGASLLGSDNASPYTDLTAAAGTTYFYFVRASNECGTGPYSASNSGYRNTAPTNAPTGVSASDGANCTPVITVTWNPVGNTAGYRVLRNTVNNLGTASQVGFGVFSPFDDNTAAANTNYFYWVQGVNACGDGPVSTPDQGNRGTAAAPPTGLAATDGTRCNSVVLTWTAAPGATGYQIFRNTVNNSGGAVQIGTDTASPYVDDTVVGSTVYFYWLRSTNTCGTSGLSATNSGFGGTTVDIDQQPMDLTVIAGQPAQFTIEVGGATAFQWRKNNVPLSNGPNMSGVNTNTLDIFAASEADEGSYACFVTSTCGNVLSRPGVLTVNELPCPADYNDDGGIDGADVEAFFADWEGGLPGADVNQDGGIDGADVEFFFEVWEAGGCF